MLYKKVSFRMQNGQLDVENRADRTKQDLSQLANQLRRASRGQNLDPQFSQSLADSAQLVENLALTVEELVAGNSGEPRKHLQHRNLDSVHQC